MSAVFPFKVRIWRIINPAEPTFADAADEDKLEFSAGTLDPSIANGWIKRTLKGAPRTVADHSNPNENLGEQQDTGLDEDVLTFEGVISQSWAVDNIFMNNLVSFGDDEQEIPELPGGIFGIEIDRAPALRKDTDPTTGYEIRKLDWVLPEDSLEAEFTLVMSRGAEAT